MDGNIGNNVDALLKIYFFALWNAHETLINNNKNRAHGFPRAFALRGNRNELRARCFANLLVFEPGKLRLPWPRTDGSQPKIKPAKCRLNFWLGRTDSNHDKENQNLLSYH